MRKAADRINELGGFIEQIMIHRGHQMNEPQDAGKRKLRYQKVEDHIKALIEVGEFTSGDRIPSERTLAETLKVNRLTVRRAVTNLARQGLLEGNGTGGTRVAAPSFIRRADVYRSVGIDRLIQSDGKSPSNKLLHFQLSAASTQLAERMEISEGEELVVIRRLVSIDDKPFCVETSHIPARIVPGLAAEDLMHGQSLYAILQDRYGITATVNSDRVISVETTSDLESTALGMEKNSSALALRLWVKSEEGQIIEYVRSVNNPKIVAFGTGAASDKWGKGRL
ncbi:GntR family transcriptional regulator [Agrobacterium tumefaciens]|uniref:GntR family transcriptional regulator n=1 Tax=Agrobacterium tumefaciens TaxID=358 RepID=UPI0012BA20E6|nr:GntR family transcriptional regulator [Agrobacterium tumefaciens]MQB08030.1 GntR family transcriptional regulator [Agrobacterium tumefaciens]